MLPYLEYERHLDETYVENQCENVCPLQESCKLFIVEPDISRLTCIYLSDSYLTALRATSNVSGCFKSCPCTNMCVEQGDVICTVHTAYMPMMYQDVQPGGNLSLKARPILYFYTSLHGVSEVKQVSQLSSSNVSFLHVILNQTSYIQSESTLAREAGRSHCKGAPNSQHE